MNLLVIGNGFDLAHGYPTSYGDFLDVINHLIHNNFDTSSWSEGKKATCGFLKTGSVKKIKKLANDNCWIKHFNNRRASLGQNWIDFEKEIEDVCHKLLSIEGMKEMDILLSELVLFVNDKYKIDVSKMEKDLKDLISLLDLYLFNVMAFETPFRSEDIFEFGPTNVISFNYTNTIEKYYGCSNVEYVHGKLSTSPDNEDTTIVLGFNSMGSDKYDSFYAYFLKYFQMVNNNVTIDTLNKLEKTDNLKVAFYGHSLDKTDQDIIKSIFKKCSKESITLYYHDNQHKESMIKNLIDIFGKEEFMKICLSNDKKIVFKKQTDMIRAINGRNLFFE